MKKSDVLWLAANKFLAVNNREFNVDKFKMEFSCDAVNEAIWDLMGAEFWGQEHRFQRWRVMQFLSELGCRPTSLNEFDRFRPGVRRQGARYLWLMFAYLVALDEEKEEQ